MDLYGCAIPLLPLYVLFSLFRCDCSLIQIYVPTGPVTRDYDDVRRFQEAAEKGLKRLHTNCRPSVVKHISKLWQ